jgi:hypothetical protein
VSDLPEVVRHDVVAGPHSASATHWLAERRQIIAWWAGGRALVLASALVVHWLAAPHGYVGHASLARPFGLLGAWDGIWYRRVAEHGYLLVPGQQSDTAFFPLYPVLLHVLHSTGVPLAAAGLLLANGFLLAAVLLLYELGREFLPTADAKRAAVLAAVFPAGYVFSMIYPESLVLTAMAGAMLLALRNRWIPSAAAAAAAALARPQGVLLVIPLAAIAYERRRTLPTEMRGRAAAAVLAGPAAVASFLLYLAWALHDPFAWSEAEHAWGRSFRADGIVFALHGVAMDVVRHPWVLRDAGLCLVYLLLLAVAARAGIRWPWIAFGVAIVLLPLTSGSIESDARFGLLAVPVYWGLAVLGRHRWVERGLLAVCSLLLVAATVTVPLIFP